MKTEEHQEKKDNHMEFELPLTKEQFFLEAVLNNIEDGIVACNAEGVLTLFNRATRQFHGLPQTPLPADKWSEYYDLYMADGKTIMQKEDVPLFKALHEETVQGIEMVIAPKKGSKRTLLASGQALYDIHGTKIGAVVSMHDITERKKAEESLKKSHDNLEKKVQERVKELLCLQNISKIIEDNSEEPSVIFPAIINTIPPSWQYSEITCARLTLNEDVYFSEKFRQTQWVISQAVIVNGNPIGKLEVFYLEERPTLDEGPFQKEERNLINIIAERLARVVERNEVIKKRMESERRREELIKELKNALGEIKTLQGIIPICSYCKQIRDDKGYWNQVESYVREHTGAEFSHGICPDCVAKHHPNIDINK